MKRCFAILSFTIVFCSCASDNDMKNSDKKEVDEKTENQVGVPNVNGNIPDTTHSIDIGTHKTDTTIIPGTDSMKR